MVTCDKCGVRNPDDARYCASCGADLYIGEGRAGGGDECFGRRRRGDECFDLPHGGAIVGIILGLFIVIVGLAILLGQDVGRWIGPSIIIVFGVLLITGTVYGLSRKRGN